MRYLIIVFISCTILSCENKENISTNEILWDTWGIPHIYAKSDTSLYHMMGWAQMHNHGNLILKLYGESRAKASEYWQGDVNRDKMLHQTGITGAVDKAYDSMAPEVKSIISAFAKGVNAYAVKNPDKIDDKYKKVLPVKPRDIVAHLFRASYKEFLIDPVLQDAREWTGGSNAWAINGSKSKSGNSVLLANPHLAWNDLYLFFEAQLITNETNLYGSTLVGSPTLIIAFNNHLGWTHTVNTADVVDLYEININNNTYELDGENIDIQVDTVNVIEKTDSVTVDHFVPVKHTKYGMILEEKEDKAIAMQWPNLEGVFDPFSQWLAMGKAKSLHEFQDALKMNQLPFLNVVYADKDKNILYHFLGNIPKKNGSWEKWQQVVPAKTSEELWNGYYTFDELPGFVNPETNWIQNANDPPYTSTIPPTLGPDSFSSHIAPNHMQFRPQRSAKLLKNSGPLSLTDVIALKHDTKSELALRLKDEFEELKQMSDDSLTLAALNILIDWDASFEAESQGAVLFINLMRELGTNGIYAEEWRFNEPLTTPDGLKNKRKTLDVIKQAAETQITQMGSLEIPFGDVYRLKVGDYEFPGNGAGGPLGVFRTLYYNRDEKGKHYYALAGDSYICVTEFGEEVTAKALLPYGNASQPANPHVGDQLELFSEKKLRDVLLSRKDHEANLELIEIISDM